MTELEKKFFAQGVARAHFFFSYNDRNLPMGEYKRKLMRPRARESDSRPRSDNFDVRRLKRARKALMDSYHPRRCFPIFVIDPALTRRAYPYPYFNRHHRRRVDSSTSIPGHASWLTVSAKWGRHRRRPKVSWRHFAEVLLIADVGHVGDHLDYFAEAPAPLRSRRA